MKTRFLCFLLLVVTMFPIGSRCASQNEDAIRNVNDQNFRRLNRKDYRNPLPVYALPSTHSKEICLLPNGYLIRCLEESNKGWWLLEFQKGDDEITAYAFAEAEELVSITDAPPSHPVYRDAFLDLEGGFAYRFHEKAPVPLTDALERAGFAFDSVCCGSISSMNGKSAAMIVEMGREKALCLLSEAEGVWSLVGANRRIYRESSAPLCYFEFTLDGKIAFHLAWPGIPGVRCLLSTADALHSQQWCFESITLYGGDNRLSRNIRVIPTHAHLEITGKINTGSAITEINELLPNQDYRLFTEMDCTEVERLLRTYFPEFFTPPSK